MPTFWSKSLIPTARQVPADAVAPSHQLMLRAGLIRMLTAGVYDYLPLGLRSLRKAMEIVRQEMDAAGGVEVFLPTLQPIELWEQTGRRTAYGENLFVLEDRHGRTMALGPTHEEVFTELMRAYIESYKQLPLTLYQIQTKFRDEFRPRFGVIRSREFQMKDAYSFDTTVEGLDKSYQAMYDAYERIFTRCGVPYRIVEAESGPIGGSASHEFMVPSPTGEDTILESDKGNYAANVEKCETGPRAVSATLAPFSRDPEGSADLGAESHEATKPRSHEVKEPTGELEKVHTPGCKTIEEVCTFFKKNVGSKLKPENMLKTLVFVSTASDETIEKSRQQSRQSGAAGSYTYNYKHFLAVIRGDQEVNEAKLRILLLSIYPEIEEIELAQQEDTTALGMPIGFIGPHLIADKKWGETYLVIDPDAAIDQFWVTGANEVDHHVKHFNWKRDVIDPLGDSAKDRVILADIRNAVAGDPSPRNDGGVLRETKGIEVGHVFKLGTKYSDAMEFAVLDDANKRLPVIMGCYGIGVNRILAGAIEREGGHDDNGIIWPAAIAPYQVIITTIKWDGEMRDTALRLAEELESMSIETSRDREGATSSSPVLLAHARGSSDVACSRARLVDVLIDDRDERPGVKFKDADLIGIPVRITIGDKALKDGNVEVKARAADKADLIPVNDAAAKVVELLKTL